MELCSLSSKKTTGVTPVHTVAALLPGHSKNSPGSSTLTPVQVPQLLFDTRQIKRPDEPRV